MKKIQTVILGTGFMGRVHTEGIRRLGNVEVAGIAARTWEQARRFADELSIACVGPHTVEELETA